MSLGVPVSINRFVAGQAPTPEAELKIALDHFIGFVDTLALMPDFAGIRGHFEMMPVNVAAGNLAAALVNHPTGQGPATSFLHYECNVRIDVMEMKERLEEQRGHVGYKTVPALKFVGQMKAHGLQYFVTSQTLKMESGSGSLHSER